jgi:hypothetical protein
MLVLGLGELLLEDGDLAPRGHEVGGVLQDPDGRIGAELREQVLRLAQGGRGRRAFAMPQIALRLHKAALEQDV